MRSEGSIIKRLMAQKFGDSDDAARTTNEIDVHGAHPVPSYTFGPAASLHMQPTLEPAPAIAQKPNTATTDTTCATGAVVPKPGTEAAKRQSLAQAGPPKRVKHLKKMAPKSPETAPITPRQLSNEPTSHIPMSVLQAALPLRFKALGLVTPVAPKVPKQVSAARPLDEFVFGRV